MAANEKFTYELIPNIQKIAEKKLAALKLTPKIPFVEFVKKRKQYYSTPCLTADGKSVFFKILIIDNKGSAIALQREAEITKFLTDCPELKQKLNISAFVDADTKNFPYWFIHQYIEGPLVGHFYQLFREGKKEKYIPRIIDNLIGLQDIPHKKVQELFRQKKYNLWSRTYSEYQKTISSYQKEIGDKKGKIAFQKIYKFFEDRKTLLRKTKYVLVHGDFTLANFFINKETAYLTDWEHSHLDNFAYDVSHLWIQLWRYPSWRRKLIKDFIAKIPKEKINEFKELFRTTIIAEALGELHWSSEICEKKYKQGAIKNGHKSIKNSLKSFEQLIK